MQSNSGNKHVFLLSQLVEGAKRSVRVVYADLMGPRQPEAVTAGQCALCINDVFLTNEL